ncbi:hypothetical protein GTY81_20030 [Streptomyces sp. SID8366]|uniref:hypothetical protein n=1 Tax=unclassified Streptomyces TaxID=2593676 RepID=UPI000DBA3311|nr:hypothetical protein [Streptomyces sp. PsTaAH-130]MYU06123.1 hypothetical protein [Streptomyces sp. SID8366]MYU61696.1 hypothetical protein [Streptomyces sp. SID69]
MPILSNGREVDFKLDGFSADEKVSRAFLHEVGYDQDYLVPLAEHHTADGHSYYVLHDESATYDHPGTPQIVALHLRRDRATRTFGFEKKSFPLPAMAQSWVISRGCPREAIGLNPELGTAPADEATRALEQRLVDDGDHFAMGYSYTRDDPDDEVTVVALRALDGRTSPPFRVVIREVDADAGTHTLREGGFDTVGEALQWCEDRFGNRAGPLPPVRTAPVATCATDMPTAPAMRPPGRSR